MRPRITPTDVTALAEAERQLAAAQKNYREGYHSVSRLDVHAWERRVAELRATPPTCCCGQPLTSRMELEASWCLGCRLGNR